MDENVGALGVVLSEADRAELAEVLPTEEIVGTRDYEEIAPGLDR